jgi:LysM repeat protein
MKKKIAKTLALVLILSSAIVYSPTTLQVDVVSAATGGTPAATTPAPVKAPASTTASSGETYVVVEGDMMWKIAKKHNLTVEQIMALNPQIKNLNLVVVGQKINVNAAPAVGSSTVFDVSKFPSWVETDGLWRTVNKTSFKDGVQYAPTEAQLKAIKKLTSLTPTSVGMTDYLMVELKDPKQQVDVVGEGNANSGTVTVLVFGDRLIATEQSLGKHTQQLDRGYYNAGIASGYMNLAAISQGLGTHFYMSTQYPKKDTGLTIEDAYLKGKGYKYTIGYDTYKRGDEKGQVEAYGNLKFIAAIVIGTLDEQAETKVTDHNYPENWVNAK